MHQFRFDRMLRLSATERGSVLHTLADVLRSRLQQADHFHSATYQLIEELRTLGHDLWSHDESDDMQVWGPNYEYTTGPGMVLTFHASGEVEVEWTEQ